MTRNVEELDPSALIPLSSAQSRIWFLNNLDGGVCYKLPFAYRVYGNFDLPALRAACTDLLQWNESLRTIFPESAGVPYQLVREITNNALPFSIEEADAQQLRTSINEAVDETFDLALDFPIRFHVFELSRTEHVVLIILHHIAADGTSVSRILRDLSTAYGQRRMGKVPNRESSDVQYSDYTLWHLDLLGSESDPESLLMQQAAYWREVLRGMPDALEIPTDRPRPKSPSYAGGIVSAALADDLPQRLTDIARRHYATRLMVIHAALAAVLSRIGLGADIPIGSMVAGRVDEALTDMVGMFVNPVIIRTDTSGNPTFGDLVGRVREASLGAYENQDIPFETVLNSVIPEGRTRSGTSPLQVVLVDEVGTKELPEFDGLTVQEEPVDVRYAKFDVTLYVRGDSSGILLGLEYSADLFDVETARSWLNWITVLLEDAIANPAKRLGELDLLTREQERGVLFHGTVPR